MDYSEAALTFARNRLSIRWTVKGDIQKCAEYLQPKAFNLILARHTVEHMRDPDEFLSNIGSLMRPGGLMQIGTPNVVSKEQFCYPMLIYIDYKTIRAGNPALSKVNAVKQAARKSMSGVNPPKHLWGFTVKGLQQILQKNGFEVLKVRQAIAGDAVFDPLYYDIYRFSTRRRMGIRTTFGSGLHHFSSEAAE